MFVKDVGFLGKINKNSSALSASMLFVGLEGEKWGYLIKLW